MGGRVNDRSTLYAAFSLLTAWQGKPTYDFTVEPLFGDASGRLYHRLRFAKGSCILMTVAYTKPGEFGRGDSWTDFLAMQKALNDLGIRVPAVFHVDQEERRALLEDLGNETLFARIEADPAKKMPMLRAALDLLITWQRTMWRRKNFDTPADARSFTKALFMEEFKHFYEYMIEKRVYHPSWRNLWPKLEKRFTRISRELSVAPYLVSHRDFQSKNLMQTRRGIFIIDFQDALQAPLVYDLVALLRDSYVSITEEELFHLLDHYWKYNEVAREVLGDKEKFYRLFFLQTVQRKMKDAGRFVYLHQVKGKQWFLPFVRPTLFMVRDALCRLDMQEMLDLLSPFIPEFGEVSQ